MRAAIFSSQFGKIFTVERTLFLVFAVGLLFRFAFPDLKLLHHDESIHSWFALRLLTEGIYSYDPVYHGPFLYYATAGMFSLFGTEDFVTRILPSLLGSLLVLLVYPIYKLGYLNRNQTIIAAVFLAVSPEMVYFSRFLRNDIFIVFFTLVILVALLYYIERKELKYAVIGAAAAGLAMSCKENMPMVLLIFGVYLLYLIYKDKFILPKKWPRDLIVSLLIITGIMAVFYSSFGQHPEILISGPFDALNHWLSMHGEQRLGGPFYFYIILFLLYELPVLILAVFGVVSFIKYREKKDLLLSENSFEIQPESEILINAQETEPEEPDPGFGCQTESEAKSEHVSSDSAGAAKSSINFENKTPALNKNREFTRFCIFWMVASLAVYAYLGEKVPWLILHQLLPMIFVAVYDLSRWKIWLSAAGVVFLIIMTMHVAFTPADISEPIVQVQNSEDLRDVMVFIDSADRVAISDEVRWPFVWYYMQDYPRKVSYYSEGYNKYIGPEDYDVIILHDAEKIEEIPGFSKYTCKKSYWVDVYGLVQSSRLKADIFDAGYRNAVLGDIKRLILYYFTRDTGLGSINIDVFVKETNTT
ncbi:MAG: TIGR03663 family protein [Methanomicrobiaceae archaeon]|nr:TIGR03663 family protein [Methanomicrobiaceae archaeon]